MNVEMLIQNVLIRGDLVMPSASSGLVIFAHGSGSGRLSLRNRFVAKELNKFGLGTLLFDLLTVAEDKIFENRFDIELLTERLIGVTKWCMENEELRKYVIGYFGASTGSAAALSAAAYWGTKIGAVVSRGGRPDLVMDELDLIEAPVLLIVGGEDKEVIDLNRKAYVRMGCTKKLEIIPGATHLFEEEGTLSAVARLAGAWFGRYLLENIVKEGITAVRKEEGSEEITKESSPKESYNRYTINSAS